MEDYAYGSCAQRSHDRAGNCGHLPCSGAAGTLIRRAEAEGRALVASVTADARARNFARICQDEMIGLLRELYYLVGGNCAKDLAAEWAEGVQPSKVDGGTRIVISRTKATVYDGPTPDTSMSVSGVWRLAELPRNRRFRRTGEAQEAMDNIEKGLSAQHMRLNPVTGSIEAG